MYPTFETSGDCIVIDRWSRHHGLQVGDIIVAKSPNKPSETVCKRVLGLPGDVVYDNGPDNVYLHAAVRPFTVPAGHMWLQGDNTSNSNDSRNYGAVPLAMCVGRATYRVWPLHRFGPIPRVPSTPAPPGPGDWN